MNALILSTALDTNGQNARYVRAAERYGSDEDVLRVLAIGKTDPAGVVGRLADAAQKDGRLIIRSAHKAQQYFDFPMDILWTRKTQREVEILAARADIIHLNNSTAAWKRFRLYRKPALVHHHGSLLRNDPERQLKRAREAGMTVAVSTIDLTRWNTDSLHWLPTAYDLPALAELRRKRDSDTVRIVHAPTNRNLKGTERLIAACDTLRSEGLPLELVMVEGKTWRECMTTKATADIVFDQLAYGYGCNAVEAWGMGIPVISGADEWTTSRMVELWGELPYRHVDETSLESVLRDMVTSPKVRAEWAAKGKAHAERFHAEKPALARLAELYAMTIRDFVPGGRAKLEKPMRFRRMSGNQVVMDGDGKRAVFDHEGYIETTDPFLAERLERFARFRPGVGIVEVET